MMMTTIFFGAFLFVASNKVNAAPATPYATPTIIYKIGDPAPTDVTSIPDNECLCTADGKIVSINPPGQFCGFDAGIMCGNIVTTGDSGSITVMRRAAAATPSEPAYKVGDPAPADVTNIPDNECLCTADGKIVSINPPGQFCGFDASIMCGNIVTTGDSGSITVMRRTLALEGDAGSINVMRRAVAAATPFPPAPAATASTTPSW